MARIILMQYVVTYRRHS